MNAFLRDFRLALRLLVRNAGPSTVVVAILAIAIGANTVIFGVLRAKVLRPLPYPDEDRLVQVWEQDPTVSTGPSTVSPHNFVDWETQNESFESMAVYAYASLTLLRPDGAERVIGAKVSPDFFSVLGVAPIIGRPPSREEGRPGSGIVILSHRLWQQELGADPNVVGQKLVLDGGPHTVIAVMPAVFDYPSKVVDLWTSPAFDLEQVDRGDHFLFGIGRLKPGVTLAAAQSELDAIAMTLSMLHPSTNQNSGVLLSPLREQLLAESRHELFILWAGVFLVLLIACTNLAGIMLARTVSRQTEISIRTAVGASRGDLVRQLFTESSLLALLGGGAGVALAAVGTRYLASGRGPAMLQSENITLDGWVLAFSGAVTLLSAFLLGVLPAFWAGRTRPSRQQQDRMRPSRQGRHRLAGLLIAAQTAIAVVLLSTAALLGRSLLLLNQVDVGFEPEGVMTVQLSVPPAELRTPWQRVQLFERVFDRIEAVPGVERVGGVNDLPFSGSRTRRSFGIGGFPTVPGRPAPSADYRTVVGDYLGVMGLEIRRGRTFAESYMPEAPPVAIINEALVERFFQGMDPLGQELIIENERFSIIGVVENSKHSSLAAAAEPEIYVPAALGYPPEWLFIVVQSSLPLSELPPMLRDAAREAAPVYPLYNFRSLEDRLSRAIAPQEFRSLIFSTFGAIAVILVLVGVYGLVSFVVRRRRREIAIRIALGGKRLGLIKLMTIGTVIPATVGVLVGIACFVPLAQGFRAFLFGTSPTEPIVLGAASVFLLLVVLAASVFPAKRAVTLNPSSVLRDG